MNLYNSKKISTCGLCGFPMRPAESSLAYHGYSGNCPRSQFEIDRILKEYEAEFSLSENIIQEWTSELKILANRPDIMTHLIKKILSFSLDVSNDLKLRLSVERLLNDT